MAAEPKSENTKNLGRKVFFLYPHSVIQQELIDYIIQNEFEVYLVYDHMKMARLLERYNESILYINIDEKLEEEEWEEYIRNLQNNEKTAEVQIGILTYSRDDTLAKKYLMDLMVGAGFVQLKLGMKESARIILKTLMVNEARGKRKFVRAKCPRNNPVEFNIQEGDQVREGLIHDISKAGMACRFYQQVSLPLKTSLERIQLKLRGRLVMVSGIVAGKRETEEGELYVILFTSYVSQEGGKRISAFIYNLLQTEMRRELESL
jgi:hypothetical protein